MEYDQTLNYLYTQLPMFQRIGGAAYKTGLETSLHLDSLFNNPHKSYKTIHVAGTNGKGSISHTIASILQKSGYKVGLYTSPHLVDFRERIRVNGKMIPKNNVTDFVEQYMKMDNELSPSFFELTMMMAFDYFRQEKVDYAVIEVGLGGRLDSTNIISPILSVISNISFDHTQFLGNTLPAIATEKAGIIKNNTPVIIGESEGDVREVFIEKARQENAPITLADSESLIVSHEFQDNGLVLNTTKFGVITDELTGDCQLKNANTILHAIAKLIELGVKIPHEAIVDGFKTVCETTGLQGRWMTVSKSPLTICDTGHNVGGIQYIVKQLARQKYNHLRIVIGFVSDKDISHILDMFPTSAEYYFTQASVPRAMKCDNVQEIATERGLHGKCFSTVKEAYLAAKNDSEIDDFIFVGGSTFIVADFLSFIDDEKE